MTEAEGISLFSVLSSDIVHILTVDPLNKRALLRMSTKMLLALRRTSDVMLPLLNFLFLQFARN